MKLAGVAVPVALGAACVILITGCRAVILVAALPFVLVYEGGHAVYKGGEKVVDTIADGASSASGAIVSVFSSDGVFRTTCPQDVATVHDAARQVFEGLEYTAIQGTRDGLNGRLVAMGADGQSISLRLKLVGEGQTDVELKVGAEGDLPADRARCDARDGGPVTGRSLCWWQPARGDLQCHPIRRRRGVAAGASRIPDTADTAPTPLRHR